MFSRPVGAKALEVKLKKTLPRHAAGSFELKEGTGAITAMCTCGDFLEIYKIDKTFRVRSPESIDPEETNPNAMWIASPISDAGSSNKVVARILLQSSEMLNSAAFSKDIDKETIIMCMHSCKELLLACENIFKNVSCDIDRIIEGIGSKGVGRDNLGRALNPFPQVKDLDSQCGTFLVFANRVIKQICELPSLFLALDRIDSNFDHLGKRLEKSIGADSPATEFVKKNANGVRYIIDLRNFHEHPKEKRTSIMNFSLPPDSSIQLPMWCITGHPPRPIQEEMFAIVDFLMQMAEAMFIHLVMRSITSGFPFVIEMVPDEEIDLKAPIKYRLTLDASRLTFKTN